ncbi:MAG: type I glyceraldehyde-3-phosphate dehydrogenase [Gammaproteobacteria bacterium]
MAIKVAINGYGRIGRNILRALYLSDRRDEIQIAAINDVGELATNVHLTCYDTTHGRFAVDVKVEGDNMVVAGDKIAISSERDPAVLPWGDLGIDVVYECTGAFTKRELAAKHLQAGAKKVIISAPASDADHTIVYGINHDLLTAADDIISNASCTTNCLAMIVKPLHDQLGIISGLMNTVHSYTNDQQLIDSNHKDLRRARSATQSIIPTKTGAAAAVGLVIPELRGKLDGFATRVPTINVSLVDLTFKAARATSIDEINGIMQQAAQSQLKDLLIINEEPLVSCDFNQNPASAIFDVTLTRVIGDLVEVGAWYDNEWGFSNRMLDVTLALMRAA